MTAPRAPQSLSAHIIPSDIRLGRFVLRPSGQPDSEGRFRWALHGPGSMGVVRRFTHTYTVAIATVATEAADRSGLDLGLDRATVTTPAPVEVPMPPKPVPALKVKPNPSAKACRIVGCNYPPRTRGVCQEHYDQARHAGVRDEVCLPSSLKPSPKVAAVKAGEVVVKAPKVATTEPDVTVKAGEGEVAAPAARADHPHPEVILREERIAGLELVMAEQAKAETALKALIAHLEEVIAAKDTAIHDALDINKALPDGHPGHAIRRAIREAGAAGVAALEEVSRLRAEITAIVTSSGVRIEGAEDLEPVEAVRRVIAELRRPEPATLDEIERALNDLDARRTALFERRERIWAAERARARLALAEEAARVAAAELEAARAEAASLA